MLHSGVARPEATTPFDQSSSMPQATSQRRHAHMQLRATQFVPAHIRVAHRNLRPRNCFNKVDATLPVCVTPRLPHIPSVGFLLLAASTLNAGRLRLELPLTSSLPELPAIKRPTAYHTRRPRDESCARKPRRDPIEWYTNEIWCAKEKGQLHRCPCRAIARAEEGFICCRTNRGT